MTEHPFLNECRLLVSEHGGRLFRNNVGMGWTGDARKRVEADGSITVTIRHARPLHAGLCEGSSDLIGWMPIDHRAVFMAIEAKHGQTRTTDAQTKFISSVQCSGGIGAIVRNRTDLLDAIRRAGAP